MPVHNAFEFFIQMHLTEGCNLRCTHCYQQEGRTSEMSLPEVAELAEETADMIGAWQEAYGIGISSSFNVTGGEPFLRPDIFEVLEELNGRGFDLYLLTNGILVDRGKASRLANLVKGVQISIEGPETVHDSIRGHGSFASTMKGVRSVVDAGIELTLNTTLSEVNAPHFSGIIDLASSLGARRLGFSRLVPAGSGRQMLDRMLGREEVKALYQEIFSRDTGGLRIVTGDPVASQLRASSSADNVSDNGDEWPSGGCAAGVSGLTILPDGTVTPCRRMPIPIGNVRQDSLREIWATSGILNNLRNKSKYGGKCGRCAKWAACRGCRAIAYAFSRDAGEGNCLSEDPQCFL